MAKGRKNEEETIVEAVEEMFISHIVGQRESNEERLTNDK